MTSWRDFAAAEPEFAARVLPLFQSQKHMTMATLRRDGSPRISGTEASFADGELSVGMMPGSVKGDDLRRDARVALHSPTFDAPDDPTQWAGDAKITGRAIEHDPDRFRVDISEVVLTKVGDPADHLIIESWHPGRAIDKHKRY